MTSKYIAKIYFDTKEIDHQSGNDIDELYNWMLLKSQGKFGNFSGDIIDVKTKKIIKSFRRSPPE